LVSDSCYFIKKGINGKNSLCEYEQEKVRKIVYISKEKLNDKLSLILMNKQTYQSTIGLNLNQQARNIIKFSYSSDIFNQIIGHMLGDGSLVMSWSSKNPHFVFTQGFLRFKYTWFVFNNINFLCKSVPRLNKSNRKNKTSYFLQIHTRSYPFLMEIFNAFYVKDLNNNTIKIIPKDIYFWLSSITMAYWAMDDGGATTSGSGFYLHTKGFSFSDVYYLVGVIHYKFDIICTVQNHENRPVLYITSKYKKKFFDLIRPYFHESMLYKLK
jgi:LAGLIDADG DNA endonuclease family protein